MRCSPPLLPATALRSPTRPSEHRMLIRCCWCGFGRPDAGLASRPVRGAGHRDFFVVRYDNRAVGLSTHLHHTRHLRTFSRRSAAIFPRRPTDSKTWPKTRWDCWMHLALTGPMWCPCGRCLAGRNDRPNDGHRSPRACWQPYLHHVHALGRYRLAHPRGPGRFVGPG